MDEQSFLSRGVNQDISACLLIDVRENQLQSVSIQQFDLKSMQLTGTPVTVAPNIGRFGSIGPIRFSSISVAPNGILTFFSKSGYSSTRLRLYDRNGKEVTTFEKQGLFVEPSFPWMNSAWLFNAKTRPEITMYGS